MDVLKWEKSQRLGNQVLTEVKYQGWTQRDPEDKIPIMVRPRSGSLTGEIQERELLVSLDLTFS